MASTPIRTSTDCSRPGSPASSVTAGMPASVAARRRVPGTPGLCSTTRPPNPSAKPRVRSSRRSARSCGRLVRLSEPVWMSTTPPLQLRMTSVNSEWAIRAAALPSGLPGK